MTRDRVVPLVEHCDLLIPVGKARLHARTLLAEGDPAERFEAAVLLHDAARAELRALQALEDPSIKTRLAARVEACGCLLLGLDVLSAIPVWRDVEQIAQERLAGHSPGLDLLYRVGLGRFAADAHARGLEDPVDVLRGGTPRALEGPHPIAPLAA